MEESKLKIYLVQGNTNYVNWIPNVELVDSLEKADLVLFEGGEDVDPSFYLEEKNPNTYSNIKRDNKEIPIYNRAIDSDIPVLGICRGSQLSCVMAGGKLVQHQPNPSFIHPMKTIEGEILVSSTHHQAQYPFNLPTEEFKILGCTENMLDFHQGGNQEELNPVVECEVVYYPKINALGIQPHPEMLWDTKLNKPRERFEESIKWFRDILSKFLNKEL